MQLEKLFKSLVFTVFKPTHKKQFIVNLYQKELHVCFSEDIKMWPSHNV